MTRLESIFGDSGSTRVTLRKTVTRFELRWEKRWLDSSHVFHKMTRLESQSMTRDSSQSHFYRFSEFLMDKPTSFAICTRDERILIFQLLIQIRKNFAYSHPILIRKFLKFGIRYPSVSECDDG